MLILKDCFEKNGDNFILKLDPSSTKPILLGDGTTVTMGEIARAVINEQALKTHPVGLLDSEMSTQTMNVFNLGHNGQFGHILMGTTPADDHLYGFNKINGQNNIFLAIHEYSGNGQVNEGALINGNPGEQGFNTTINVGDITSSINKTTLGYRIAYDGDQTGLLNSIISSLRPIPIRENVEKSVRGVGGSQNQNPSPIIPPIIIQSEAEDENESRRQLEEIAEGDENREKLHNLPFINSGSLEDGKIIEGRVFKNGPIKYNRTTPDNEEEYELYQNENEDNGIFIRGVLENPYLVVKYIDEDNETLIPVKADKGVKLTFINGKNNLTGMFLIGSDFYWINMEEGVFNKVPELEEERIKKLKWIDLS